MSDAETGREDGRVLIHSGTALGRYADVSLPELNPRPPTGPKGAAVRRPSQPPQIEAIRPVVYTTYFCGVERSSLAAAVRDGVGKLAMFAATHLELQAGAPMVRYRNRRGTTVTIDIGVPINDLPDGSLKSTLNLDRSTQESPLVRKSALSVDDAVSCLRAAFAEEQLHGVPGGNVAWQLELTDQSATVAPRTASRFRTTPA